MKDYSKSFEVIMNIPSPYRVYLFEELARQLKIKGIEFKVNFMSYGHDERPKSWLNPKISFPYHYWYDYGINNHHFNPGMIFCSWFKKPDVLLVGSPFDTVTGILASFTARAKIKCTWVEGQTKTPGKMTGFKGWFKRLILSQYKFVAVPGHDAANYIEQHQKLTKIKMPIPFFLPNLIDESRFRPREMWPEKEIIQYRNLFKASNSERVCLIPARLDTVKGLVPFLEAVDENQIKDGWKIVIMGQGPLKKQILDLSKKKGINDHVIIIDYVPYEQMPICYAASDIFLLPSIHDPNPLSVPEALHSGLPIALSDQAGNIEEGVTEGRNGWRLPVNHYNDFKEKLKEIFSTTKLQLQKMGNMSKNENAQFWNTKTCITNFINNFNL